MVPSLGEGFNTYAINLVLFYYVTTLSLKYAVAKRCVSARRPTGGGNGDTMQHIHKLDTMQCLLHRCCLECLCMAYAHKIKLKPACNKAVWTKPTPEFKLLLVLILPFISNGDAFRIFGYYGSQKFGHFCSFTQDLLFCHVLLVTRT